MKDNEKIVLAAVGIGALAVAVNAMKKPDEGVRVEITSANVEKIEE